MLINLSHFPFKTHFRIKHFIETAFFFCCLFRIWRIENAIGIQYIIFLFDDDDDDEENREEEYASYTPSQKHLFLPNFVPFMQVVRSISEPTPL